MARITYPDIPNLQLRPMGTNAILEALTERRVREEQERMFNTNVMLNMLREINPAKFTSYGVLDMQAQAIEELENKFAKIAGDAKGAFTAQDLLRMKFDMDQFESLQNYWLAAQEGITKEWEEFQRNPDDYQLEAAVGCWKNWVETGTYTPGDMLKNKPYDLKTWAMTMQPNGRMEPVDKEFVKTIQDPNTKMWYDYYKYTWATPENKKQLTLSQYMQKKKAADVWLDEVWNSMDETARETMEAAYKKQLTTEIDPETNKPKTVPISDRNTWLAMEIIPPMVMMDTQGVEPNSTKNQLEYQKGMIDVTVEKNRQIQEEATKQYQIRHAEKVEDATVYGISAEPIEDYKGTMMISNAGNSYTDKNFGLNRTVLATGYDTGSVYHLKVSKKKAKEAYRFQLPANYVIIFADTDAVLPYVGRTVKDAGLSNALADLSDAYYMMDVSVYNGDKPLNLTDVMDNKEIINALQLDRKKYSGIRETKKLSFTLYPGMPVPSGVQDYPSLKDKISNGNEMFSLSLDLGRRYGKITVLAPKSEFITKDLLLNYFKDKEEEKKEEEQPAVPSFNPGSWNDL